MEYIQYGENSAFEELYARYSNRLLYYFFRMLGGDNEKAQDFLQDVFLKIIENHENFRITQKFSTWIYTIAYNLCKNEYRRLAVRKNIDNHSELDYISDPNDSSTDYQGSMIDMKNFNKNMLSILNSFDPLQRSTFLLRYQENYSIKTISEILRCSEGTTKSRLFYATRKLAKKLKEFNPEHNEELFI
jgi:RNA polymerase sigma-70 factor (ECF subfamily)